MSEPASPTPPAQVDLSELKLMPDWVSSFGNAPAQRHREYEEREERGDRRGGGGGRGGFGGGAGGGGGRPPFRGGNDRGGERRGGPGGGGGFKGKGDRGGRRDERGGGRDFERPEREPLPTDIIVSVEPEEKAADAVAAYIRSTGRAFSMFDAARLVLESGDRFRVRFTCAAERPAGLFIAPGGGVFLSSEEAVRGIVAGPAADEFYTAEDIELEEPKGDFKSIGICGMSGEMLGPPSHHSYQTRLMRTHRERYANLPFEEYKRRVRVESDPELIVKWKEQQRKGVRWIYLKSPEGQEPLAFKTRAEMEAHFRREHAEGSVTEVRDAVVAGNARHDAMSRVLGVLLRRSIDVAKKHLFEFSQRLSTALDQRGMKLFKRRSGKLYVSRVRPRALDAGVVLAERVMKIVEAIKAAPGIPISKLLESIAPSPQPAADAPATESAKMTDEQVAVHRDLRWLADEGYVIEYSDGAVFLGVQGEAPAPRPPADKASVSERESVTRPVVSEVTAASGGTEGESPSVPSAEEPAREEPPPTEEA